ncbi:MAG: hypothetical protein R2941_13045 [Desulfobacterales bacterium]
MSYENINEDEIEEQEEISIGNKWILEAGGLIKNLEGFTVDTLPTKYKINLKELSEWKYCAEKKLNTSMKYELLKD